MNVSALGMIDGSSWGSAYTNLDTALARTSSGDMWIAAGTADGSPAINIGQLPAPEFDIEGSARVNAPDAGAYEYQLDVSVIETLTINYDQLKVAPNPVSETLDITLENQWTGNLDIRLFSTNGQLMGTWNVNKGADLTSKRITVSDVAAGLYDLVIGNGKEAVATRIIKIQ